MVCYNVVLDVLLLRARQLSSPAAKAGHECREGCHRLRLLLAKVAGKPLVTDVVLESREGLCVWTVDNFVFVGQELSPEFSGRFPWLLNYMS